MTNPTRRRAALWLIAPLAAAALAGCASGALAPTASPEAEQAALIQRAKAYWEFVRTNDNVGAWAYEAQSQDPRWSLESYLKKGGIVYEQVEVRGVRSIEGDEAVLDMWVKYSLPLVRISKREHAMQDRWRRIDGVWYHAPPRSAMFSDR